MAGVSSRIKMERFSESAKLHSPLMDFEMDIQDIEIRKDPLTGNMSIIGLRLVDKLETLIESTDDEFLNAFVNENSEKCFFCPEKVHTATPKFPEEILPEGRITVGESVLFPNLFPLSKFHAIIVLSKKHFLKPQEFAPSMLRDAFLAAREFVSHLPPDENLFGSLNCNYMPPAGASAVHAHLQLIASSQPTNYSRKTQDALLEYSEKYGHEYWDDLIELEKELGVRYVGQLESTHWFTPFSPTCTNEVFGLLPSGKFKDTPDEVITSLAQGVSNVLEYYGNDGYSSFNFSLELGDLTDQEKSNRCFIRLATRQNFTRGYRAGEFFFQHLLNTEVVVIPPEIVASKLRGSFVGA